MSVTRSSAWKGGVSLNPQADKFRPSVIRRMTLMADEIEGAINLSQGMPDFDAPDFVKDAALSAITAGHNQYAPPVGTYALRQAVSTHSAAQLGFAPNPDQEVTITCGATEAMYAALLAVTRPGDRVLVPSPYYENYWADCVLTNLVPEFVRLRPPSWHLDLNELRSAFAKTPPPRAIVFCNPNNPTGTVYSPAELNEIAACCRDYDTFAIVDEVYEHIIYDAHRHCSIASLEGMRERTITISSASKTFSVTGWRVGSIVASPEISAVIRQIHDYLTISAPRPFQEAIARAYETAQLSDYYAQFRCDYERRRNLLRDALVAAGYKVNTPEGAYYLLADITESGIDDVRFAERMLREAKVAVVPASCFFDEDSKDVGRRHVRFCFCKRDSQLIEAAERLSRWAWH